MRCCSSISILLTKSTLRDKKGYIATWTYTEYTKCMKEVYVSCALRIEGIHDIPKTFFHLANVVCIPKINLTTWTNVSLFSPHWTGFWWRKRDGKHRLCVSYLATKLCTLYGNCLTATAEIMFMEKLVVYHFIFGTKLCKWRNRMNICLCMPI